MPPGGHPATHAQAARTSRVFVPPPAREKPDRLRCLAVAPSRETMTFTAAEAVGGHQETLNRALADTRSLDWLDDTLT